MLQGRHRRLRPPPQRDQGPDPPVGDRVRGRGRRHGGRDRDAVERILQRVGLHLRQHHQHPRGRHPRGGLPRRADLVVNKYAHGEEAAQGAGRQALRRGHPRGPGRDHLGQAGNPQFEGQTKTKLGNTEAKSSCRRSATTGWPTGSSATRPRPRRSSPRRRPGGPGPHRRAHRRASWPGASRCWSPARCRASWPTASPPTRASPSCSSSRATRPAARPSQGRDPMYPGDPADPRQDPQRGEGPDRPGAARTTRCSR